MTGTHEDAIRAWVETSGRALELRVARAFSSRARVEQSVRYSDRDRDVEREIDVVAEFSREIRSEDGAAAGAVIRVYAECKTAKAGAWVGFVDPNARRFHAGKWEAGLFHLTASNQSAQRWLIDAWEWHTPFAQYTTVSHVADAHVEVDGSNPRKGRETSYDAMRQIISASRYGTSQHALPTTQHHVLGVLPLIVTTIPLYLCELDGAREVQVRQVAGFAARYSGGHGDARLLYVHESALEDFLSEVAGLMGDR